MADQEMPKQRRTGEKLGWLGGWTGGFIWVLILGVIRLAQGHVVDGLIGLGLFVIAVGVISLLAPWRYPTVRFWKLMTPLYVALFASIAWVVWTWDGFNQPGLTWWSFFWILPCLIPFWTIGGKRWDDRSEGAITR